MLQNRNPIIYGDGEQKRSFSDIDDCIFCIDKLLLDKKVNKEVVNIGPDENFVTINELFEILSNKLQFNKNPKYYKDRPNEVKYAKCSSEKARKLLNYNTSTSLDDAIEKTANYIKNAGEKEFKYHLPLEIINKNTPSTWKDKLM